MPSRCSPQLPLYTCVSWRAAALCGLLLTGLGCSRSPEPAASTPPPAVKSEPAAVDQPPTPSKLPVPEFEHSAALPPSEPLPKPKLRDLPPADEEPATKGSVSAEPKPAIAANPLRVPTQDTPTSPLRQAAGPLAGGGLGATADRGGSLASTQSSAASKDLPKGEPAAAVPPAGRPQTSKNSGKPFDPIKENGPIFVGWGKPKVALVITGMEEGYLEPCGCAGLDRMKGGMTRRATLFKQLRQEGWPIVGLDVGGLVQGFGRQAELKFQTAVEGKRKMGYDSVAFGTDDLRLPAGELVAVAASVDQKPSLFVSANVGLLGKPGEITPESRVIKAGGVKIGVTAVLGKKYQKEINNPEIEFSDPVAALKKITPELKQKADYLVLLAHTTLDEAIALGKQFPAFNVVVCSDGQPEPPKQPQKIDGTKSLLITVGYKGMNAIVLGLFDNGQLSARYERVPLDSRFAASRDMKLLMAAYQEQLKAIGFAGLGLRPVPHPQAETNGRFIGAKKCASCHEKSYDIWKKSGHAKAYDTLVKLEIPRQFDPECISCHVTGWHPTKFFPYVSGYESIEKTPHLVNASCEDCHGPGEKHAAAEIGSDQKLQEKLRKAMVVTKAQAKKQQCYSCHDLDNSPDFDFDKYWPFVEHKEKE